MIKNKIYIILLNYNNWKDTILCIESVLKSEFKDLQLVVVDNNSSDNSMDYFIKWAEGSLSITIDETDELKDLYYPPIQKPVPYLFYDLRNTKLDSILKDGNDNKSVVFIQTGRNGGFAYGNNIGIKYALAKNDFDYIWILNNDTVVKKDALTQLVEKAEYYKKANKKVGIIGSKIFYYSDPTKINTVGGIYNKWFGVSKHLGVMEEDKGQYDCEDIVKKIDYISGASMFVSREFIEDVGFMFEDYFLYYEELDWILRGKRKGWQIGYCWDSVVYHKEGAPIGSNIEGKKKSELADYYFFRNRIKFTKKFCPQFLITVYLGFIITVFNRIRRGQFRRLKLIWKVLKS